MASVIQTMAERTNVMALVKQGRRSDPASTIYACTARLYDKGNIIFNLKYLKFGLRIALLNLYSIYRYNEKEKIKFHSAIDEIIRNVKRHINHLNLLSPSGCFEALELYAIAIKILIQENELDNFFELDAKSMCTGINKLSEYQTEQAFTLFPYFKEKEYFLHAISNSRWHMFLKSKAFNDMARVCRPEVISCFCSRDFHRHKFLRHFVSGRVWIIAGWYYDRPDIIDFLDYLEDNATELLNDICMFDSLNLEAISDCTAMIDLLNVTQKVLKGVELRVVINFLKCIEYDKKTAKKLNDKLEIMDEFAQRILFSLPSYMTYSWLYGRETLRLAEKPWFARYERHCLYNDFDLTIHHDYLSYTVGNPLLLKVTFKRKNHFIQLLLNDEIGGNELYHLEEKEQALDKYTKVNELNPKQIHNIVNYGLLNMPNEFLISVKETPYTYSELEIMKIIYSRPERIPLSLIFKKLLFNLRSDDACIRIRQFINVKTKLSKEVDIEKIADALVIYDIPMWAKKLYTFKVPLELVIDSLPFVSCEKVLREAKNEVEARFILQNTEICKDGLLKAFSRFTEIDTEVLRLKQRLALSEEFYNTFSKETTNFFVSGCAQIANTYLDNLINANRYKLEEKYHVVLKAAMCDKLKDLRYHDGDLEKECSMNLKTSITKEWIYDREIQAENRSMGPLSCVEDTSFIGIMEMGFRPIDACMSYIDGEHLECLLSYFDGNKKILFIKNKENKIIARAVIRLTKMTLGQITTENKLDFVDVTKIKKSDAKEFPIIFLEKMYAGFQGESRKALENLMTTFVVNKAEIAGVTPVVSCEYDYDDSNTSFVSKNIGVYITKSKAGEQYLDSFGGKKSKDAYLSSECEDVYVYSDCYIPVNLS